MKIPFMLILGDREAESRTVAVRARREGDLGSSSLEEFIRKTETLVRERSNAA